VKWFNFVTFHFPLFHAAAKHKGFEEEREWRFVSQFPADFADNLNYRQGSYGLTPFYKIPLSVQNAEVRIDHIRIGPYGEQKGRGGNSEIYVEELKRRSCLLFSLANLFLILACAQLAVDQNSLTLEQIRCKFCETAVDDDVMPLGSAFVLAVLVLPGPLRSHLENNFHAVVLEGDGFGVVAEVADELDFV
jgi:hypothetical protein